MQKISWFFIPLLVLMMLSPVLAVSTEVIIGSNNQGLLAGLEVGSNKREKIGFLGYQDDYLKGMVGMTTFQNKMVGYIQGGRDVFVGNLKYQVSAYAGNLNYRENFLAGNRLGVAGDVMQIEGEHGYGIKGEVNLIGSPGFSIAPYFEWRKDKVIQVMAGIGSHTPYLLFQYLTNIGEEKNMILQTRVFPNGFDGGIHLFLENDVSISGTNTGGHLGLGLKWSPSDEPFSLSFNWHPYGMQWTSSYRF